MGYVVLNDPLRHDAIQVISTLKSMRITPHICTGADDKTALRYAGLLGIAPDKVRANCVSHATTDSVQSKKQYLDELKAKGYQVAAVGDAANDAEMIVASDVGFAIRSSGGNEHTQQQAAAVIQGSALLPIVHAFSVARQTVANIKQNLIFSLLYNGATVLIAGGLLLALGFVLNPAIGAVLMILQTSLILLNVYRFAKQHHPATVISSLRKVPEPDVYHRHAHAMKPLLIHKPVIEKSTAPQKEQAVDACVVKGPPQRNKSLQRGVTGSTVTAVQTPALLRVYAKG